MDGQVNSTYSQEDYKKLESSLLHAQDMLMKENRSLGKLFKQVERAKQEWENTMDCIADIVILTDKDGKIRRFNKTLLKYTGKSKEKVLGSDWEDLMSESNFETVTFYSGSIELRHRPTHKWFTLNSYPFKEDSYENSGSVITVHDTTELKNITEKLENAYSELKATQSTILQREKMASIGQLSAGIAHEINNPLGFISSNLGTLGKYMQRLSEFITAQSEAVKLVQDRHVTDELSEKRKKLKLDYILEDVEQLIKESLDGTARVTRIVQNLKSFSRIDEADYTLADINECIESTLNIVWNELKYKANVHKNMGKLPLTKCYPQQLNQVFVNLLVNAAHAIETHGEITIRTWHEAQCIHISISDSGSGMPRDRISRIFEPFFTTKEPGKGTGLGLSISYEIVKKHNGDVTVDTEEGKGTTFTVSIPVVKDV